MLAKSIQRVRPFGVVATIGQAGGAIPPVSVDELRPGRSLDASERHGLYHRIPRSYLAAAKAVVEMLASGIAATIAREYALEDAAQAQQLLEEGRAAGSSDSCSIERRKRYTNALEIVLRAMALFRCESLIHGHASHDRRPEKPCPAPRPEDVFRLCGFRCLDGVDLPGERERFLPRSSCASACWST